MDDFERVLQEIWQASKEGGFFSSFPSLETNRANDGWQIRRWAKMLKPIWHPFISYMPILSPLPASVPLRMTCTIFISHRRPTCMLVRDTKNSFPEQTFLPFTIDPAMSWTLINILLRKEANLPRLLREGNELVAQHGS
jgi:hypothetical protein